MLATQLIRKHEVGLRFRDGDYQNMLAPGRYRFWSRLWSPRRSKVDVISTLTTRFEHQLMDVLLEDARLRERLLVLDLAEGQRALVWRNRLLMEIVGPGRHVYWKTPHDLEVETFDVAEPLFEHPLREAVVASDEDGRWFRGVEVQPYEEALLFRDGVLAEKLTSGRYVYWNDASSHRCVRVDMREARLEISGQEIMTQDKVTLRLNLQVGYRVRDSVRAVTASQDFSQALYGRAQLALRAAVGARGLDALLTDKESLGQELQTSLRKDAEELGCEVTSVGLKDVILPGEMKAILNQVIEAEKRAQANLIRRREEVAAARSQANTARLLAENPALARMKELEILQEILVGTEARFVFGSGDLLSQIGSLVADQAAE